MATALASLLTDIGMVVIGPISTSAEAEPLVAEEQPELAVVGALSQRRDWPFGLVDGLHERGVRVIVLAELPRLGHAPGERQRRAAEAIRCAGAAGDHVRGDAGAALSRLLTCPT